MRRKGKIIVLGYDQGLANAGCCVMQFDVKTKKKTILFKKYFITSPHIPTELRIKMHYDFLMNVAKKYKVNGVSCEFLISNKIAHARNKSAKMMTVNTISAIVMLVAANNNAYFKQFLPMTVKKRFTGSGKSDKEEVIACAIKKYKLRKIPIEHVADAIAIADTLIDEMASDIK